MVPESIIEQIIDHYESDEEAYVKALVKNNTKQTSNKVTLKKGTYTYFCPLNKTPEYTLIVE